MMIYKIPKLVSFIKENPLSYCNSGSGNTTVWGCRSGAENSAGACGTGSGVDDAACQNGTENSSCSCTNGLNTSLTPGSNCIEGSGNSTGDTGDECGVGTIPT
ncbi:MAG: hypothetical protein ABIA04_14115 [Pseudomonadota bacterium]